MFKYLGRIRVLQQQKKLMRWYIFWREKIEIFETSTVDIRLRMYRISGREICMYIHIYRRQHICAQIHECIRCTYAYTYVASGHVYGCEFPSERFNFSTIASPSTIDAPLRAEKSTRIYVYMCVYMWKFYTRPNPSLLFISP